MSTSMNFQDRRKVKNKKNEIKITQRVIDEK